MRERGLALVWALLFLGLVAAAGVLVLERGRALDGADRADRAALQAYYAARGGVEQARWALARDPAYAGGPLRVGGQEVVVVVQRTDDGWRVTARSGSETVVTSVR